jgi:hypothetical protein
MKKWFKYILITTLMFVGINQVGAANKTCYIKSDGTYYWGNSGATIGQGGIMAETTITDKNECTGYAELSCTYTKDDNETIKWTFKQDNNGVQSLTDSSGKATSSSIYIANYKCADNIYYLNESCGTQTKGWYSYIGSSCSNYNSYTISNNSSNTSQKTYPTLSCKYYSDSGNQISFEQNQTGIVTIKNSSSEVQYHNISKVESCPDYLYYLQATSSSQSTNKYQITKPGKYDGTYMQYTEESIYNQKDELTTVDKEYTKSCSDLGESLTLLRQIYTFMRYLVPILIVVLSIVDFAKVVLLGDEKTYKAAWDKFIKRLIIGVVILILPAILSLIINMSGALDSYGVDKNNIFCIFS